MKNTIGGLENILSSYRCGLTHVEHEKWECKELLLNKITQKLLLENLESFCMVWTRFHHHFLINEINDNIPQYVLNFERNLAYKAFLDDLPIRCHACLYPPSILISLVFIFKFSMPKVVFPPSLSSASWLQSFFYLTSSRQTYIYATMAK